MIKQIIFIFIGGGLGSIIRYGLGNGLNSVMPYGTLIANVLGCFIIGIIIAFSEKNCVNQNLFLFAAVGFCGGFTTFSSFAAENFQFLQNNEMGMFLLYAGLSFVMGLIFVWLGFKIAHLI